MSANTSRYRVGLGATLRSTSAAYGYTLTVATTAAGLTTVHGAPGTGELFLFAIGGLSGFALLELLLLAAGPAEAEPPGRAFPFVGVLNVLSVTGGLGAASLTTHLIGSPLAWLGSPLAATAAYLMLVAAQVTLVEAVRR